MMLLAFISGVVALVAFVLYLVFCMVMEAVICERVGK